MSVEDYQNAYDELLEGLERKKKELDEKVLEIEKIERTISIINRLLDYDENYVYSNYLQDLKNAIPDDAEELKEEHNKIRNEIKLFKINPDFFIK